MLLLHCFGIESPNPHPNLNPDPHPFNLSSFTIESPIPSHAKFQEYCKPTQPTCTTNPSWTHEEVPAIQSSSRTVAFGAEETQHVLDTCPGCRITCKQSWPDCNCSKDCLGHLPGPKPASLFRPLQSHGTPLFTGGFVVGPFISPAAMVVTKAEVLLEQQLRSLRSQMDSGEALNNRDAYQNLHQRHQAVSRASISDTRLYREPYKQKGRHVKGPEHQFEEEPAEKLIDLCEDKQKVQPVQSTRLHWSSLMCRSVAQQYPRLQREMPCPCARRSLSKQ